MFFPKFKIHQTHQTSANIRWIQGNHVLVCILFGLQVYHLIIYFNIFCRYIHCYLSHRPTSAEEKWCWASTDVAWRRPNTSSLTSVDWSASWSNGPACSLQIGRTHHDTSNKIKKSALKSKTLEWMRVQISQADSMFNILLPDLGLWPLITCIDADVTTEVMLR